MTNQTKRKNDKKAVFSLFFLSLFYLLAIAGSSVCSIRSGHTCNIEDSQIRAVSLKILQSELSKCNTDWQCPENLLQLAGLKEISGYIFDKENNDIILIGCVDPNLPAIHTQDLVIALRNAWMKYATLRGDTYYYSNPGCSIDPNPKVIQQLNNISASDDKGEKEWHQVCSKPQKVRVMGIPFDTRFAKVMVIADYDMKTLVDQTDQTGINGLKSLTDMTMDKNKKDIYEDRPITVGISMNRFWFYPGENIYQEDKGIVLIKQCSVTLLTENEYSSGNVKDDPLAEKFAADLTAHYDELSKKRPIYKELENLYVLVAVAKLLKSRASSIADKKKILSFFLNDFNIPETPVKRELPGRSTVKRFERKKRLSNGYRTMRIWLPSCGGVTVDIDPGKAIIEKPADNSLLVVKEQILSQRDPGQVYWDI